MRKPPPPAIRYLVLLGAVVLLVTAVCTKTEKANEPEPQSPAVQSIDAAPAAVETVPDAAPPSVPAEQAQQVAPPPAPNPPANTKQNDKSKNKNKRNGNAIKPKEEFFPASKSGGMF